VAAAADVVVVGGGVVGSAEARSLARRGRSVVLLERFSIGHDRGSSHGRSRIFRFSYHDPRYVRMAQEALPLWRALEAEAGEAILQTTGGLDTGTALDDHLAALEACGARFEVLDGVEVRRRFPALSLPDGTAALFQPDAGIVLADRAWRAFVAGAVAAGAAVREEAPALAIRPGDESVEVDAGGDRIHAGAAVVTAGAWAPGLLGPLGIDLPLRPTRETVAFFRLPEEARIPTVVDWGEAAVYALPSPGQGVKAGEHQAGPTADPDRNGGPDTVSVGRLGAWVAERYPGADPEPHLVQTCLYTNAPGDEFVLERRGPVVVGSPCSGHGFKFAPWVGERLADLAEETL